jgi:hypothetical protein
MNTKGCGFKAASALALFSMYFAIVGSAHAVPVTYSFTSARSFEANLPSSPGLPPGPPLTILPDQIFVPGELFSGTFTYDSDATLLFSVPTLSVFSNALTSLTGSVDGHQIAVPSAHGSIGAAPFSRLSFNGNAPGTSIGDWVSSSFSLAFGNYTQTMLPALLPPVGLPALSQISLHFTHSISGQLRQVGFGSVVVTQVAEPASWALFMFGALTLALRRKSI